MATALANMTVMTVLLRLPIFSEDFFEVIVNNSGSLALLTVF